MAERGKAGALSEVGYGGSDGGPIIKDWAVINVIRRYIETLAGAPLQERVFVDCPSCVEDWREEGVGGRGVV